MAPIVRGSKHPITAYYSVYRPRKDERLSRPGWLVTYRNKVPPPGVKPVHVTQPSTNRARRRVTSLIRPTLLPLRHSATHSVLTWWWWWWWTEPSIRRISSRMCSAVWKETNSRSAGAATCDASEAAGCRSHACFTLRSLLLQFVDSVGFEL